MAAACRVHSFREAMPKQVETLRSAMGGGVGRRTWGATTAKFLTRGRLAGDGGEDQTGRACYFDGPEADAPGS